MEEVDVNENLPCLDSQLGLRRGRLNNATTGSLLIYPTHELARLISINEAR